MLRPRSGWDGLRWRFSVLRPWYLVEAGLLILIVAASTLFLVGARSPLGLPTGAVTVTTFAQCVGWLAGAVLVLRWYLALDEHSVAARLRVAWLMTALLVLGLLGQVVRLVVSLGERPTGALTVA